MPSPKQARAAATRARLLRATVQVLVDHGYSGATTQAVCRQAECSRGTLLYHFPNREELLVAAMHQVLADQVSQFMARATAPMSPEQFVRSLWSEWQGAPYTAWLELAVAARTAPSLREPLRDAMADFDAQVIEAFQTLVPDGLLPDDLLQQAPFVLFALFNGLAVGRFYDATSPSEPIVDMVATMTQQLLGGTLGPTPDT